MAPSNGLNMGTGPVSAERTLRKPAGTDAPKHFTVGS